MTLAPSGVRAGGNFWCLLCIGIVCIWDPRTTGFPKKAKTSKHHFYSSVWIAVFWHFKKSGVSWTGIWVCLACLLESVFGSVIWALTWAQVLQSQGLRAAWGTGISGVRGLACAVSAGIGKAAEFLLACHWAALPWDAGFAALHLAPCCRVCGSSVLLVTSSLLLKVFLNKASRPMIRLKLCSEMLLFRNPC